MNEPERFEAEKRENIRRMTESANLQALSRRWIVDTAAYKYCYHFTWMGRPLIQFPQDLIATQEIIWRAQPDLIVETGIAHGGSLIFYASMLELQGGEGQVVGIDIDIRKHNRVEIENHRMFKRITLIEGSSTDTAIVEQVLALAKGKQRVLVVLDSNHTHAHVRRELELYSPLVTKDSYLIVFDTVIEDMPEGSFPERPWDKGNNPKTAVWDFLRSTDRFVVDKEVEGKLLITTAFDGYLRCVKELPRQGP